MSQKALFQPWYLVAIGLVWLSSTLAAAQTTPGPSGPAPGTDSRPNSGVEEPAIAPLINGPSLDQPGIKELGGSGNWFSDNVSLFSWGPVAVRSAEVLYSYSTANPESGLATNLSSGIVQANVAYSKRLPSSLLVLQYNPRLLYNDGQVSIAAANQDAALNMLFAPLSHVTVGFSEGFSYYGPAKTLNEKTLASGNSDAAVSNPFLNSLFNTQQRTLLESFSVPIDYRPSERTSFRFSPLFNYVRISENGQAGTDQETPAFSMFDYGAQMQMSHALSENQTIGTFYTYQMDHRTGVQGATLFHSFGVSASRRMGQSLTISAQGGGSYSSRPDFSGWTAVGSVSVSKTLRHGSLEGSYGRDSTFTGFIGSNYNNRAWLSYSERAGLRMSWNVGGGYLNGMSLGQKASGEYATARMDYAISPTVTWSFSYVHIWETGGGAQLVNGRQSQFQLGIRWTPRVKPGT